MRQSSCPAGETASPTSGGLVMLKCEAEAQHKLVYRLFNASQEAEEVIGHHHFTSVAARGGAGEDGATDGVFRSAIRSMDGVYYERTT